MHQFVSIIFTTSFAHSIFRVSTSLIFAGLAAVVSKSCGVDNIAIEGMMLCSALAAVVFSAWTHNAFLGLVAAILVSMLIALVMSYFILSLKTHNVMSGLSINVFAKGITVFLLFVMTGNKGASTTMISATLPKVSIPVLQDIPVLGPIFSGQNVLTYFAFVAVALVSLFLYRTRTGLHILAVGEVPHAAESVGISVLRVRYTAMLISGFFAGIAGAYLSLGYMDSFTANMINGRGFIALAACSVGQTMPWGTCFAALLFGCADALAVSLQTMRVPAQLVQMIPYVVTIIGVVIFSMQETAREKALTMQGTEKKSPGGIA